MATAKIKVAGTASRIADQRRAEEEPAASPQQVARAALKAALRPRADRAGFGGFDTKEGRWRGRARWHSAR
eukprot:5703446-Pleurochrysis_carterae.AAC.1